MPCQLSKYRYMYVEMTNLNTTLYLFLECADCGHLHSTWSLVGGQYSLYFTLTETEYETVFLLPV